MSNWSITETDPFYIKEQFKKQIPAEALIDLSRGEPINTPDVFSDKVFQFFWELSLEANGVTKDVNLKKIDRSKLKEIWLKKLRDEKDESVARACREFVDVLKEKAKVHTDAYLTDVDVLLDIISEIRGEDYLDPAGSFLVKLLMGGRYEQLFHQNGFYPPDTVVLTNGGSEAIGTLMELIDFSGFVKNGDTVAMVAPVYSPYKYMVEKGGYQVYGVLGTAENNFIPEGETLNAFRERAKEKGIRLLVLVNPGNPSGVSLPEDVLRELARIAIDLNMLIVEDVVYADFLDASFASISAWAPEHTITVVSSSKFYQAPGTRFGALLVNRNANSHWSRSMNLVRYKKHPNDDVDFYEAFLRAKGPDPWGTFYYTHHVPGPIQWMSAFRLAFGKPDGIKFVKDLKSRKKAFYRGLGLKEDDNEGLRVPYYVLLDCKGLIESVRPGFCERITPEEFVEAVFMRAKIAILPAAPFFLDHADEHKWFVRVSMANATELKIKMAAQRISQLIVDF